MSSFASFGARIERYLGLASVVLAAVAASGCGASSRAAAPALVPPPTGRAATPSGTVDGLPSLDMLAARGPTDAPLMRELLRVESAAPRSPDVRADEDLCVRAVFAAPRTVRAYFVDTSGASRGETTTAASGTVPPRGPVCARKGESLHLVVESEIDPTAPTRLSVRAVIFAAP